MDEQDLLLSDDLLPVDGALIADQVHDERKDDESKEAGMVKTAAPMRDFIMGMFDGQIASCDSIDNLDLESGVPVESQLLALKVVKQRLIDSKNRINDLFEEHIK